MSPKREMSGTTVLYTTLDCEGYIEEKQINAAEQECENGFCNGEVINDITHCKEKCSMLVDSATRWGYSYIPGAFGACFCNICNVKKTQTDIQKELNEKRKYWNSLLVNESSICSQCAHDKCLDPTTAKRCIVSGGCNVWAEPSKCVKGTCHLVEYEGRFQAQCG